jgi:protein-S-isoprenylcysteine O-methyltransferase Ste14
MDSTVFFVFEGILALVLINHPHWFTNSFSPLQCLSWFLLAISIFFVTQAVIFFKRQGGYVQREETPENHAVENTVRVVDAGLYRYVRHSMYSSLLDGLGRLLQAYYPGQHHSHCTDHHFSAYRRQD